MHDYPHNDTFFFYEIDDAIGINKNFADIFIVFLGNLSTRIRKRANLFQCRENFVNKPAGIDLRVALDVSLRSL